jgi:imidazoleglycerol phosphate dehydratase HisB
MTTTSCWRRSPANPHTPSGARGMCVPRPRPQCASASGSTAPAAYETGAHHTAEDTAIAVGEALDRALGDRRGIARYGSAVVPMDDALARAAVDLGGRRGAEIELAEDPGLARHALESFANAGRMTLHVSATGRDPHHVAEAACKAVGRALRDAVRRDGDELPSTKGVL